MGSSSRTAYSSLSILLPFPLQTSPEAILHHSATSFDVRSLAPFHCWKGVKRLRFKSESGRQHLNFSPAPIAGPTVLYKCRQQAPAQVLVTTINAAKKRYPLVRHQAVTNNGDAIRGKEADSDCKRGRGKK